MKRRVVGIALVCLILLAAIFAGYWDMLTTEKMRIAADGTVPTFAEIAGQAAAEKESGEGGGTVPPLQRLPTQAAQTGPNGEVTTAGAALPTFDILRVEPDGSTVMAGKAAAGATVRLTDGTSVLGEETAGPGGDFAIVLDKPLPVGEHQIRIEATHADGTSATSRETAIVSVPERGREHELLAMVETPDQPSRLISVPKAESKPMADAQGSAPTVSSGDGSSDPAVAATSDPAIADRADVGTAGQMQSITVPTQSSDRPTNLVAESALAVEAVEIEDDTIYVAGRAPAGPTVRIYVDNVFLAEDAKRTVDRFLVSARSPVPPGEHMVRADQVGPDGSVLARVEVPFIKPEGRSMSAIAGAGAEPEPVVGDEERLAAATSATEAGAADASVLSSASKAGQPTGAIVAAPDAADPAGADEGSTEGLPASPVASGGAAPAASDSAVVNGAIGVAPASQPSAGAEIVAGRQAPLQAAGARVIIRRGDTLWRISREVYGRGARYTTIYLANGDQIRNPNRIYPGQVFRMPESDLR